MSKEDFNALVELAMRTEGLSAMRPVVEKELLHYDIFHALDSEGLLTFRVVLPADGVDHIAVARDVGVCHQNPRSGP